MSNIRANRVAEEIKKEMGEIITRKLKDPRIGFVTVTDVEVTGDLQQATIYISVLDEDKKDSTLVGLAKANGFIRSEIVKRFHLRKTSVFTFDFYDTFECDRLIV